MKSESISTPLDYAPAPRRRQKWIRWGICATIIVASAFSAWRWGPIAWRQAQMLYWQRQCLQYAQSPDFVIYEEDSARAAALIAGDQQYSPYFTGATFNPRIWAEYTSFLNIPWLKTRMMAADHGAALMFMHELTSPAGQHRLVSIWIVASSDPFVTNFSALSLEGEIMTPATLTTQPILHQKEQTISTTAPRPMLSRAPKFRVFSGQVDPKDPSHFTIRYQMLGQEDIIDGRLDDNELVTLTPRKMPGETR